MRSVGLGSPLGKSPDTAEERARVGRAGKRLALLVPTFHGTLNSPLGPAESPHG